MVYPFDVDENDPNLVHWQEVWEKHAVVDAYLTHEYWYLDEVTLEGKCFETNMFGINEQRVFGPEAKGDLESNLMDYLKYKRCFSQESLDLVQETIAPLDSNALFEFIKETYPFIQEHELLIAGISEFAYIVSGLKLTPVDSSEEQ